MSFIGSAIDAATRNSPAQIARETGATNLAQTQYTNTMNFLLNSYSHGAPISQHGILPGTVPKSMIGQSSAILPYYFGNLESRMSGDASSAYDASNRYFGSPTAELAFYKDLIAKMAPAQAGANTSVNNLFNGNLESDLISQAQPVWDQNVKGAQSEIQAGFQALAKTLNDINSIQAKKGFTGDSAGNNMLKFGARQNILQQGAGAMNTALLSNATGKQAIQSGVRSSQLQNINLPMTASGNSVSMAQAPLNALASRQQSQQAPFRFFNVGPNPFTPFNTSIRGSAPYSGMGQSIGSDLGQAASIANQYIQNGQTQNMMNNLRVANFPQPGNGLTYNPGSQATGVDVGSQNWSQDYQPQVDYSGGGGGSNGEDLYDFNY